jgi:hypothetical protein
MSIKDWAGRYVVKYKQGSEALKDKNDTFAGIAMHHYGKKNNTRKEQNKFCF